MKTKIIILCASFWALVSSCVNIDNYDEPEEALSGKIIDSVTNEPLVTEQPNGYKIKLTEISWSDSPIPEYFWGKADGTFRNSKIFRGTYEISPVQGAFFPVEPVTKEIKGETVVDFVVTPYLSVEMEEPKVVGNELNISYTISRAKVADKIIDARVFISTNNKVGFNIVMNEFSPMEDLKGVPDEQILNKKYTKTITGMKKGVTYYVRVGARTDNPDKRYNFTKIKEFVF